MDVQYHVWASLARDYLAIMGSSVSSERAFSAAGIAITKHRNRLCGDIVEALQFLKCLIRKDIIYREVPSRSVLEYELENVEEDDGSPGWEDVPNGEAWDTFVIDDDDELEPSTDESEI